MANELIPARSVALMGEGSGEGIWADIPLVELDKELSTQNLLVSNDRKNPAYMTFDILRTRLLQAVGERGWVNIGITSPTVGCGKTFVATNLAISLARRASSRIILMDMSLRAPELQNLFGIDGAFDLESFLNGHVDPEEYLVRVGSGLALGLNSESIGNSAELMQENMTADVLEEMQDMLAPDVILYDLPAALSSDEVIAFLPRLDGILLVVGGGMNTDAQIREVEMLLDGQVPLLGTVLNRSEDSKPPKF